MYFNRILLLLSSIKTKFLLSILLIIFASNINAQIAHIIDNWEFKQVDSSNWRPATVPGTVHTDLLNNQLIPDPFYRDNETKLQWIADKNWEYRTVFYANKPKGFQPAYLQFEGLDTYADVFLNDVKILHTDNMFRTYTVKVSDKIKSGENKLHVIFYSATHISDSLANTSTLHRPCENNRNYTRKSQYHFGWDWAPRFVTCGIWRNVNLIYSHVKEAAPAKYTPVKLIQKRDWLGQSFYFTVKDKPVFMKGANWIPADVFLPRITHDKYRELLLAAKEANFNMLRVWGGGIYEDDYFYDLCDSLNIYVWQDFMFAGAMYPGDSASLENIKQEAIDNILRLRKHPCIALWCGNNEIDEAWNNWGWMKQYNISKEDSIKMWKEYQSIFKELLPSLVAQYDSGRSYISTSPLYGWGRKQSMGIGDSHYWGMWWGMDSISIMKKKIPRFMSEYGMQAMPNIETINEFALANELDTSSAVIRLHQKHPTGFTTLNNYLKMENIEAHDFLSFITGTQELQKRALSTAINAQRNSNGRCMGTLLWQFNDCWPVCSWSIVDYYGRKKAAYEAVKTLYKDK